MKKMKVLSPKNMGYTFKHEGFGFPIYIIYMLYIYTNLEYMYVYKSIYN